MKFLKLCERILPLLFWLFLIFAFDTPRLAFLTLISAVIHELGHVIFGFSRGIVRLFPSPHPTGFRIKPEAYLSYKDEIILLIGGPVSNFLFFFFSFFIFLFWNSSLSFDFAVINLLTALSNLLPIRGYDGYRILESLLLFRGSDELRSLRTLFCVSFLFTALLCFLSLYLLLKLGEGYWIFGVFFSSLLIDLKKLAEKGDF